MTNKTINHGDIIKSMGLYEVTHPRAPDRPPVDKSAPVKATRVLACKRIAVRKVLALIPIKYLEALEHNQQIASCCRHPEDHDIEAFRSRPEEEAPDIYIFHCRCGRQHRRFCIGGGDVRPFWEVM